MFAKVLLREIAKTYKIISDRFNYGIWIESNWICYIWWDELIMEEMNR